MSSPYSESTTFAVILSVTNFQASHYVSIAGVTLLFYDYLLCLSSAMPWKPQYRRWLTLLQQITYVWGSPLYLPIILYYTVRYLPIPWAILGTYHLLNANTTEFCQIYIPGQLLAQAFTYIPATWLLCIRVLALYHSKRYLKWLVYACLIVTHVGVLSVGAIAFDSIRETLVYSAVVRDCYAPAPRMLGGALLFLLPIEILLVALQLNHSIAQRHLLGGTTNISLPILQALYQDGAIYFVLVFAMRLWTGLQLAVGAESLFYLSIFAEYAFTSTAISRLFIHLRSVARQHMWDNREHSRQEHTSATVTRPSEINSMLDPFGRQRQQQRRQSVPMVLQMPRIECRTEISYI